MKRDYVNELAEGAGSMRLSRLASKEMRAARTGEAYCRCELGGSNRTVSRRSVSGLRK